MVIFIISLLLTSLNFGGGGEGVGCVIFQDIKVLKKFTNFWELQYQYRAGIALILKGQSIYGFLETSPFVKV